MPWTAATPARPPSRPVALTSVDRSHRAVLENLGQLFRHDLSEAYGLLPNDDGTFNNRPLDLFFAQAEPRHHAWLITVAARTAGFVLTNDDPAGGTSMTAFFVVRALRRTGVGHEAALQAIAATPGRWSIGFQRYNPGAEKFWSRVATAVVGDRWEIHDEPTPDDRPPDSFITFDTAASS